jgi:tRNA A37 threonylcarbamoyladenosine synthetase subunit TsaC/SUA5/YrdC
LSTPAPRRNSWAMTVVLVPANNTAAPMNSGQVLIFIAPTENDILLNIAKAFQPVFCTSLKLMKRETTRQATTPIWKRFFERTLCPNDHI